MIMLPFVTVLSAPLDDDREGLAEGSPAPEKALI
jgi:hypothetical protein